MKPRVAFWLIALAFLGSLSPSRADWTSQPELPDWAQRGKLYWCLHYATHTRDLVELFLDGKQTIVHGGAFDSPETAEYARQQGLRYMPYVCSRTLTLREIEKHPQLKNAVLLNPDGSDFLAYNNPVRRYGSLFSPAWPEFVRQCTREVMDKPDAAGVFYDNVYVNADHHPLAVAAWKQWATRHGIEPGESVPELREVGPRGAAGRAFLAEATVAYYAGLRAFNRQHEPPMLISPNLGSLPGYGPAIMEAGAVDLVFYETMSHPPFENNAYRYKLGLAASHGRPTGILAYLPMKIAMERGTRTWSEGMHYFFYPSSPMAEEFSLAAAEAAACGGTYIPCYHLFPSLPITDRTDPFNQRIHRAIKQSYTFLHANERLYTGAAPGSNVALFHSTATQIQGPRLQNQEGVAKALTAAGIPFEVVVAADLIGKRTAGLDTLVVQNALYLDEATTAGILRFAQDGGRVVLSGRLAQFDPIGRVVAYPAAKQLADAIGLTELPLSKWKLDGFEPEGSLWRVKQKTGVATIPFGGPAGRYVARIRMLDENDGVSPFSLAVGGKAVFQGKLDIQDEKMHWFSSPPFDVTPGDLLTLTVNAHAGERGRTESVVLVAAAAENGMPLGAGQIVSSHLPMEELPAEELVRLARPKVRLSNPGKTFVNVLDCPGSAIQAVHLVNYDFRYRVTVPGLYATDDGEKGAMVPISKQQMVVRKRLTIDNPAAVVEPVLQVYGYAGAKCTADLVVSVNGRPAGRIPSAVARRQDWLEVPLDRTLLTAKNLIDIHAEGSFGANEWFCLGVAAATQAGNHSSHSVDGGKTFVEGDVSPLVGLQAGEFMIRIVDRRPLGVGEDIKNLAHNPGFEATTTLHAETELKVAPAERGEVVVKGSLRPCLAISPEAPPFWLEGRRSGDTTVYIVPRVDIHTMLALSESRAALESLFQTQMAASSWKIPPVTTPLRQVVVDWEPYGKGFVVDTANAFRGKKAVRCENTTTSEQSAVRQQFDLHQKGAAPLVISAWSRAENVSGKADSGYSIYVDATCDDGSRVQVAPARFPSGTQAWNQAVMKITSPKPIRVLSLYLMFRGHTGRVWFDDVEVKVERP